ncbi:MAG: homoserine O-succinyltransferase [Erysipelotrichaceae bacterium]|nr:homoserine O-succinyltransferase [Erysipelotrichaceae bacterium]MDD3809243.1 homoserine O-succinyltransferase [Erysipelotrichaceae bacterium]
MPIIIPDNLPASSVLKKENVFVMNDARALLQDIRPLKILILNIMPQKIITETQLLRLISNSPLQIEIELIAPASHESKNTPKEHLLDFYKTFDEIKENYYDGLIVTGAPVELMNFEDVDYWDEIKVILEWSKTHVFSSMFICWGAQAGLYYFHGIEKVKLPKKITGIYEHTINKEKSYRRLVRGFDSDFFAPHSRYTASSIDQIRSCDEVDILAESKEAGAYLIAEKDGSRVYVTGHPEYDKYMLDNEYRRDLVKMEDKAPLPKHYYRNDDYNEDVMERWKSHAYLLFSNWLNMVYQDTPFKIEDLENLRKSK